VFKSRVYSKHLGLGFSVSVLGWGFGLAFNVDG